MKKMIYKFVVNVFLLPIIITFGLSTGVVANENNAIKYENQKMSQTIYNTVKPRPPISIDYKILEEPTIGQPLDIEIIVASTLQGEAKIDYRALNEDAINFMPVNKSQQSFKLSGSNNKSNVITVVPQRIGRNYITISTQVDSEIGPMSVSRSIAIQVGNEPYEKKINGELVVDPNGDAVISMKAR